MNIMHLFPTPVAEFHLGRSFTEDERLFVLQKQERRQNIFNQYSVNSHLLNAPELSDIRMFVDQCVEQYTREVWFVQPDCRMELTQSWANYTTPGGAHHKHSHFNAMFSGVLYLQADGERDRIQFERRNVSNLQPTYTQITMTNAESWWLPVATGVLLLFPSTLEHLVNEFGGDMERCSIAFNVFPRGVLGSEAALTEARI